MTCYINAGWDFSVLGLCTVEIEEQDAHTATFGIQSGTRAHIDLSGVDRNGGYGSWATSLQTSFNASGSLSGTYTVSFDQSTGKYTFGCDEAFRFGTDTNTLARRILGIDSSPTSYATSYTSENVCYYTIVGTQAGISSDSDIYEKRPAASDVEGDDGVHYGIAKMTRPLYREFRVPMQDEATVHKSKATETTPWTFEHLFEHCRAAEPIAFNTGGDDFACYLRADGAAFRPERVEGDWDDLWNIDFRVRHVGFL